MPKFLEPVSAQFTLFVHKKIFQLPIVIVTLIGFLSVATASFAAGGVWLHLQNQQRAAALSASEQNTHDIETQLAELQTTLANTSAQLSSTSGELTQLQNEDPRAKNKQLQDEIKNIQTTYKEVVKEYNNLLKLREDTAKTQPLDAQFAKILVLLGDRNYTSASDQLALLQKGIAQQQAALATVSAGISTANLVNDKNPPSSGYRRQVVDSDAGSFIVDIVAGDLSSTRVVVETASSGDCHDNCPVAPLVDYVSRAGGYAGINGPYFCPAEYPSCVGKTNSFDTLLMNRQKTYFNSDNNVYSTVPAIIFSGGGARVVGQSLEWGRDTGVDAVIAAQPLLISGGEVRFGGDGDPKKGSRGNRSFIAVKGNVAYIGVVRSATVAEVARVLKAMSMDSGLNLDSGGSVALMNGGKYLAGPGRQTPFGIVFVRK
jgi:hypothetical protein